MKYRSTIDRLCRIHTHGLIQDSYSNKKHYRTRKKSIFCLSMRPIVLQGYMIALSTLTWLHFNLATNTRNLATFVRNVASPTNS